MRDALGPGTLLGYCTNVHAGATLDETRASLVRHALPVRDRVCPGRRMGVGLWLAQPVAAELRRRGGAEGLGAWLERQGLLAFTLNGFPFGDFHQPVVRHDVYRPDWTTEERVAYTIDLSEILVELLGSETEGSISTLPLGWRAWIDSAQGLSLAADNLLRVAAHLAELETRTGRLVHLDLEPEPGCMLETGADAVRFFEDHLLSRGEEARVSRYLRVCHDVCHSAVMFERQDAAFDRYARAALRVGKVQLSSAVSIDFDALDEPARLAARADLARFAEPRYLHQTVVRDARAGTTRFFSNLDEALASTPAAGEWRVHFHVPLFAERFGHLGTTAHELRGALDLAVAAGVRHFEVETYAWGVLPRFGQDPPELAEGIAKELEWLLDREPARPPA